MRGKLIEYRKQIFIYSILLILFTIPFDFGYITAATIIFIIFNLLAIKSVRQINLKISYVLLISMFIWSALSIFWSTSTTLSTHFLVKFLPMLLIPIVLLFCPQILESDFKKIWKWFSRYLSILFIGFIAIAAYKYSISQNGTVFLYHPLVSPLDLNAIYVSYMVSLCLIVQANQKNISSLDQIVKFILGLFLILLSSKLIIVLTLVIILLQLWRANKYRYVIGLYAIVMIGLLSLIGPVRDRFITELDTNYHEVLVREEFNEVYDWKGSTIRLLMTRVGIETLNDQNKWIEGVGAGASQPIIEQNLKGKKLYYDFWDYNFHNQYVQLCVELGIIGLFIYILFLGHMIVEFKKNILFLSIVVSIICWGLSESFMWRQRGLILFLIVIALLCQTKFRIKRTENEV